MSNVNYHRYIEDIFFIEVNTKYDSSSVLKTSEFSRMRSTSKNSDVYNSRDEIYLVVNFHFILYFLLATCNVSPVEKGGAEKAKTKIFSKLK